MSTGNKNDNYSHANSPAQSYYSIGEVARLTAVKTTVLRFWESEFPDLCPRKNKFGHRVYTKADIEVILLIKKLLYQDGLTIRGAKNCINQCRTTTAALDYRSIRDKLAEILQLIRNRSCLMHVKGRNKPEDQLIEKVVASGNAHVFHFWPELNHEEKDCLINDLQGIDFAQVTDYYQKFVDQSKQKDQTKSDQAIEPAQYFSLARQKSDPEIKALGRQALEKGAVAFLTVAGGQASRLGYEYPKGCFPISPIKKKSLFQIFAEKIKFYQDYYQSTLKWFIMTSVGNHQPTIDYFKQNNFFGLNEKDVIFFSQGMLPTITMDCKLILKDKCRLFRNPDGHGGVLKALLTTGLLSEMEQADIHYLSYFQVDNPLINMADPQMIGFHIKENSYVTTKVIEKVVHNEKLGNIALVDQVAQVIEYSDISDHLTLQKNADGSLKYRMGSIGIHIFSVDFLKESTRLLPIHFACKKVKGYRVDQAAAVPAEIEAIKFERFVFDIIPLSQRSFFFETQRSNEFFPLKNKTGVDSIATCIEGQKKMYLNWLKESGFEIPDQTVCEISPLFAPDQHILVEKVQDYADKIKKSIYKENGNAADEIYIE